MKKLTTRLTAMLLAGMLVIGSVPGAVFAADVDAGQTSEYVEEVFTEEETAEESPEAADAAAEEEAAAASEENVADTSEETAVQYYTVTLDANGGYFENEWDDAIGEIVEQAEVVTKQVLVGGTVAVVPVYINPDGQSMLFAGWSLERDGELMITGDEEYAPVGNCVLYALWVAEDAEDAGLADTEQETEAVEETESAQEYEDTEVAEDTDTAQETAEDEYAAPETDNEQDTTPAQEDIYADEKEEETSEEAVGTSVFESSEEEETVREDSANGIVENGTCGENLTWTLDDAGTLTISGTGEMENYGNGNNMPWSSDLIKAVIIENGVTSVGNAAFYKCINLKSMTIPESVTSIGISSFPHCYALESVTIPDSVTNIGNYSFWSCTGLNSLTISNSITKIGSYTFANLTNLTNVIIPNNVISIESNAFFRCSSLTSVTIPNSVTSIGDGAFDYCSNISTICFEGNAPSIEATAFGNVTATAYYPANDPTWTENVRQNYGGDITWVESDPRNGVAPTVSIYSKLDNESTYELRWQERVEQGSTVTFSMAVNASSLPTYTTDTGDTLVHEGQQEIVYDNAIYKQSGNVFSLKNIDHDVSIFGEFNHAQASNSNNPMIGFKLISYTAPSEANPGKGFNLREDGHCVINASACFGYDEWTNWFGLFGYKIPLERYQEVFGEKYTKQIYDQNISTWGGNCFGMAATAAMFYLGLLPVVEYTHDVGVLAAGGYDELTSDAGRYFLKLKSSSELTKLIERYQIWAESNDYNQARMKFFLSHNNDSSTEYLADIVETIRNNKEPLMILIWWDDPQKGRVGHCVLADSSREPEDIGGGWYRVFIYDPNNPFFEHFGDKNPKSCYLQAENRFIELNINNGQWRMTAAVNGDGTSKTDIGYDSNGNLIPGSTMNVMSARDIPTSFDKKAAFGTSDRTEITYACNDFIIKAINGQTLYEKNHGQTIYLDENVVDLNDYVAYCEDASSGVAVGKIMLPKGEYITEVQNGYVSFSSDGDYAGIVTKEQAVIRNVASTELEIQSDSNEPINIVIENVTGDAFESIKTDIATGDSSTIVAVDDGNLTINTDTDQTVDVEIITNQEEQNVTNIEVKKDEEATIELPKNEEYTRKSIEEATITGIKNIAYTGKAITQTPVVMIGDVTMEKDTDYTVSYSDNIAAGTAAITITGIGQYEGAVTKTFTITPVPLTDATVSGISNKTYTGSALTQNPTVKVGDQTLTKDTDYTVSYANNTKVGTATVTITGKGNYTGTVSKTFKINGIPVSNATVSGISNKTYTGSALTQNPTVKVGDKTLKKGTDYTISYANNTNVGTATVTITGKGNYASKKTVTFKINKAAQSITAKAGASRIAVGKTTTVSITGNKGKKSYKSSNTAIATVTSTGKVTAKKVGTVKITATSAATANYKAASKIVTIKVVPAATASLTAANQATGIKLTWKKVTGANGYKVYRGSTLIKTITSGSTVSFVDTKANTNGTKYTYKVVAKATTGDSTLSKSRVIYRVSRPAVSSVTNSASKKMTVKWGKNAKATGYQIQYNTDKTFKSGNKAVNITSASTVSKVIGSLTKGKTYYVRIRTYKTVGSTKYWSVWSAARSVKISK